MHFWSLLWSGFSSACDTGVAGVEFTNGDTPGVRLRTAANWFGGAWIKGDLGDVVGFLAQRLRLATDRLRADQKPRTAHAAAVGLAPGQRRHSHRVVAGQELRCPHVCGAHDSAAQFFDACNPANDAE